MSGISCRLRVVAGPQRGATQLLPVSGRIVVGRSEGDWILKDPQISASHFEIRADDGALAIRDLGSMNGVKVNGEPVAEAVLGVGSEISVGAHRIVLEEHRPEASAGGGQGVAWLVDDEAAVAVMHAQAALLSPELKLPEGLHAVLEVVAGPDAGTVLRCDTGSMTIGRAHRKVALSDTEVSRDHAVVEIFAPGMVFVRDLASTNGTTWNGTPATVARLQTGDVIGCGRTLIRWSESEV